MTADRPTADSPTGGGQGLTEAERLTEILCQELGVKERDSLYIRRIRDRILAARAGKDAAAVITEPDNHHNAYACPYCLPHLGKDAAAVAAVRALAAPGVTPDGEPLPEWVHVDDLLTALDGATPIGGVS